MSSIRLAGPSRHGGERTLKFRHNLKKSNTYKLGMAFRKMKSKGECPHKRASLCHKMNCPKHGMVI